jgi:hypothetical protein
VARVDGYLTKPFGPQELLTAVQDILAVHGKPMPTEKDRERARLWREAMLQHRTQLLHEIISCLSNVRLEGALAVINGQRGCYQVSLNSGQVTLLPNKPICIVPQYHTNFKLDFCLPFEATDARTEQIISTVLMFAADQDIRDTSILQQLLKEQ